MTEAEKDLNQTTGNRSRTFQMVTILVMCVLSAGVFLISSQQYYKIGFPLDDAWIHQTYARNLVEYRQWVYIPGQVSAGSTAPLWSVLLSFGYLMYKNFAIIWTFLLGVVSLFGLAMAGGWVYNRLNGQKLKLIPWIGIFFATEWHLVWGSVSGMETIFFAFIILVVVANLLANKPRYLLTGILIGLSCWVRPDGITLLGPAIFLVWLGSKSVRLKIRSTMACLAGFAILFSAYLIFNYSMAGTIWPNTFYAKQAEYAILISQHIWKRFGNLALLPMVGAGSVLFPGLVFAIWKGFRNRDWKIIALFLWWLGYTLIYAMRLPVTYQHGRYLMPAMPIFFIIGLVGSSHIIDIKFSVNRIGWWAGRLILFSIIGVQLIFVIIGARSYAEDVAIIESEMVATAKWLGANTEADAVIAAHDIGAIGFFSQRNILDLAGLVSPEVVPFIRDEIQLAEYLDNNKVKYLVTFPGWYPQLVSRATPVFQTNGIYSPLAGGENMAVYIWSE